MFKAGPWSMGTCHDTLMLYAQSRQALDDGNDSRWIGALLDAFASIRQELLRLLPTLILFAVTAPCVKRGQSIGLTPFLVRRT
jgi:hypothetical protein